MLVPVAASTEKAATRQSNPSAAASSPRRGRYTGLKARNARAPAQTERETSEATRRRQQETLGRELAKQLCAGGAQRRPYGHLAAAADAANDEEVRDVRARDEQKEPDGACDQ